ncbi:hypothetical protein EGW08_018120 [Elysia chlorotica]|uniref:Uncharacterized protein n=1 Tax=Elysia chlorotica TaxID=188477 RepID=A0A3S0ZBV3_ELYCH|nr:hypothetical protein EGW08_018120 [Elysia chlorotica]
MEMASQSESGAVANPLMISSTEMEVPLCDHSMKRQAGDTGAEADRKQVLKKRRSSLSSRRRSIVAGDVPLVDSGPEPPSDSASQESCPSSGDQPPSSQSSQGSGLKPHPENLRMDSVIEQMKAQIEKMNKELEKWNEVLEIHMKNEEESRALCSNLDILESSVAEDVKELAYSECIKAKLLDPVAVRGKISNILANIQFDREVCCKNLTMIKTFAETVHRNNQHMASQLEQAMERKRRNMEDEDLENGSHPKQHKAAKSDPKEAVAEFIANC